MGKRKAGAKRARRPAKSKATNTRIPEAKRDAVQVARFLAGHPVKLTDQQVQRMRDARLDEFWGRVLGAR